MAVKKCKSGTFPCPAGERCPDHRALAVLIREGKNAEAFELLQKSKQAPTHLAAPSSKVAGTPVTAAFAPLAPVSAEAVLLRAGIFAAASRTYGEVYVEPVVRKLFGLTAPGSGDHDAVRDADGKRYEIKSSKVLLPRVRSKAPANMFERISGEADEDHLTRAVSFADRRSARYDANIQNVKRDHFDFLIFNLLFKEGMQTFCVPVSQVSKAAIPNWSDKHGRYDEEGKSGQFTVSRNNIAQHEAVSVPSFYSWDELVPVYKEIGLTRG